MQKQHPRLESFCNSSITKRVVGWSGAPVKLRRAKVASEDRGRPIGGPNLLGLENRAGEKKNCFCSEPPVAGVSIALFRVLKGKKKNAPSLSPAEPSFL